MNQPFVYAELHASDLSSSSSFYGKLFGWQYETHETPAGPYLDHHAQTGPSLGMRGLASEGEAQGWVLYVEVPDIEAKLVAATEHGATVLQPLTVIPEGRFAILGDPSGARFGMFQKA